MRKSRIKSVDLIVIGAGLAGSAMAWQAHWRGLKVAIIDRQDVQTSSKVAAGLVTPITGARAAASWRWNDFYPTANLFYSQVERTVGAVFWHIEPALRVFHSQVERESFQAKWIGIERHAQPDSIRAELFSGRDTIGLKAPYGICRMDPAARLDTIAYLAETQRYFEGIHAFHGFHLQCDSDIVFESMSSEYPVKIAALQLAGKRIAFCQGIAARENRFFSDLPLHPARGDILLVKSPGVACDLVIHHHAWAVPMGEKRYLIGATYDRDSLQDPAEPSDEKATQFRGELMQRWESLTNGTFEGGQHTVLEQRWAVRPASYDRHPLIGPHNVLANAFCLNGLGSKGTLMAPRLAEISLDAMNGASIDPTLLRSRRK